MIYLCVLILLMHLAYTWIFARKMSKRSIPGVEIRSGDHILIWLLPFIWIFVMKRRKAPVRKGRFRRSVKSKAPFYESEIGYLGSANLHDHNDSFDVDGCED